MVVIKEKNYKRSAICKTCGKRVGKHSIVGDGCMICTRTSHKKVRKEIKLAKQREIRNRAKKGNN